MENNDDIKENNTQNNNSQNIDIEPSHKSNLLLKNLIVLFGVSIIAALAIILNPSKKPQIKPIAKISLSSLFDWNDKKPGIGWVEVKGVIMEGYGSSPFDRSSGKVAKKIKLLANKKNVKSIVLDINSPGGTIAAVQEIYDAIMYARKEKKKPVIALFKDVAASGGYYIACACDKIVSFSGSLTGSIGVIFQTGDLTGLLDKVGVKFLAIKSGKHKDIGSVYRKMTTEERKILQSTIDDYYGQFLDVVMQGRKIPKNKLKKLADGRIFSGTQAHKEGLVDYLGGTDKAVKTAQELAGLKGKVNIIKPKETLQDIISYINIEMKSRLFPTSEIQTALTPKFAYLWVH